MIRWFTKNHVAANVLMLAILLYGGYLAYYKLGVEIEPSLEYPKVEINIPFKGASPDAVEKQIILPVEKSLDGLSGIESIDAYARKDRAYIYVNAEDNVDLESFKTEIQSRVEAISTFPQNDDKPKYRIPDSANWKEVISIAVYGDVSQAVLLQAARKVRDDLSIMEGISKVSIKGSNTKEIAIEVRPDKLEAYGLTFNDVINGIRSASVDVSAGAIKSNGQNVTIRSNNKAFTGEAFKDIVIRSVNGSSIRVSDIATVIDGFEQRSKESKLNGKPVIMVEVMRLDGENALTIADIANDYIAKQGPNFPNGIELTAWDDDSVSLRGRLNTLFTNLFQGSLLVIILLGLFLRPKIALWVTIGIPVSFCGAIICMYYMGITANNMSLFGFIIVLGMVVDDAIVTGENIYAKVKSGDYDSMEAAIVGTEEVATPVTFGIITTIVAFLPLNYYDDSYIGNLGKQIPAVVIPVLIFSLIESKLILPAHLKSLKTPKTETNFISRLQRSIANFMEWLANSVYTPILKLVMTHRLAVILLFVGIFSITYAYQDNRMKYEFIPSSERYFISAELRMKEGTERQVTEEKMQQILATIEPLRNAFIDEGTGESILGNVVHTIGGKQSSGEDKDHEGKISIEIIPPSLRVANSVRNVEIVKKWLALNPEITGADRFKIYGESNKGKNSDNDDDGGVTFKLRVSNDEDTDQVVNQMKDWLSEQDVITNTWGSRGREARQLQVSLKPIAKQSQLDEDDIASQIRTAFFGQQVQKIQRDEDEIKVMLRLPKEMRDSFYTLDSLRINLPDGHSAPFSQFAVISETTTPPSISREDKSRTFRFGASSNEMSEILELIPAMTKKMDELCIAYPSVSWQYSGEVAEHLNSNNKTKILFIYLILALFALLAIPFKSFLQPLYVLLAVPFGIVGSVWGHALMGLNLSVLSLFGMLALAGIVVNDSLVMVDYINTKRLEGVPLRQAVMDAGSRRFRPIILTSITTFVGLIPLMFETSIQAQFLIPMAVSLGFGILFATAITLILIPCAYMLGEESKGFILKLFGTQPAIQTPSQLPAADINSSNENNDDT